MLHHSPEHVCGRGQHFVDGVGFSSFGGKRFLSYFFGFYFFKNLKSGGLEVLEERHDSVFWVSWRFG